MTGFETTEAPAEHGARHGAGRRFLERVVASPPDECVTWPFGRTGGYAVVADWRQPYRIERSGRRRRPYARAYRVAWELHHDRPFPEGLQARHMCGGGADGCVNPLHIEPGTPLENRHDTLAMGRNVPVRGERNGQCKLSDGDVARLRSVAGTASQRQLAALFGISQTQVSRILAGLRRAS